MKKIKKVLFITLVLGMLIFSAIVFAACQDTDDSEALKLDAPQNVFVNTVEKSITWDKVTNATGYVLLFDNGNYAEVINNYYDYGHISDGGEYYFRVMAVGTTYNDSDWSTRRVFQVNEKLVSPANIEITESVITWDSVKNASGYAVQIGSDTIAYVSENIYAITDFSIGLSSIKVKAISEKGYFLESDFSEGEEFFAGLELNLNNKGNAYELIKANTELSGDFVIPSIFKNLPVITVSSLAFDGCNKIVSMTVPNSIINIYRGAFAKTSLQRISLSFEGISDETPINSDKVSSFHDLFKVGLELFPIPKEVIITGGNEIGAFAFETLPIEKVVISTDIKEIHGFAFYNCKNLESIIIPNHAITMGTNIFGGCSSLKNIVLPDGITEISNRMFARCSSLTEIKIPDSVTKIGEGAFAASGLKGVVIPDSVTEIDPYAFQRCTQLKDVTLSKNLKILEWQVFEETAIKSIVIPHGVEEIYHAAFRDCMFLEYIIIPETVKFIDSQVLMHLDNETNIVVVYYQGTDQQWSEVDDSSVEVNGDLYFFSTTEVLGGRHWRYVDDVPAIW